MVRVEILAIGSSLYMAAVSNVSFWRAVYRTEHVTGFSGLAIVITVFVAVAASYAIPLCLLVPRVAAKPVLAALIFLAAVVNYFTSHYVECIDVVLLRNVLATPINFAAGGNMIDLVWSVMLQLTLPALVFWRVRVEPVRWPLVAAQRIMAALCVMAATALAITVAPRQDFVHLTHAHKSLRRFVVPDNALAALVGLWTHDETASDGSKCQPEPDSHADVTE